MNNIVQTTSNEEVKKGFSIIGLAFKNVFTYTWINFKIVVAFACLTFLISLFTVYNVALNDREKSMVEETASANLAYIDAKTVSAKQEELINQYFGQYDYQKCAYYSFASEVSAIQKITINTVTTSYLSLLLEDKTLTSNGKTSANVFATNFISQNDLLEMKKRFGYDEIIIGKMPQTEHEIVLSAYFIEDYGLSKDDILNKDIKLQINGINEPIFVGKVTGIIREEYYELAGHMISFKPGIILNDENPLFKSKNMNIRNMYSLKEWIFDKDVLDQLKDAKISYNGNIIYSSMKNLNNVKILANNLYIIIGTALIIGLVLMILMMVNKYVKIFSRSSGILLTFGLERKKLYILLLIQIIIISLVAMPAALGLTIGGYYTINFLMKVAINLTLEVSLKKLFGMFFLSSFIVFAISIFFFGYTIYQMRGSTIKELLNTTIN